MNLIDYTEESTENEPSKWTQKAFKKYFVSTYWKTHHAGGAIPWTMKEQVQLSRMIDEHPAQDLADMMMYWHINTSKPAVACQFTNFYSDRVNIYHRMKKATNEYRWE